MRKKVIMRNNEGSILIGLMLLVLIIVLMFVFAFEVSLLYLTKEKNDAITKNMSSSLILNIDEGMMRRGMVDINRNEGERIVEKIKNESYSGLSLCKEPIVNIDYINNGPYEVEVIVTTEVPLNDLMFFKDKSIKSKSKYRAYSKVELKSLTEEVLQMMSREELWDLLVIEEVS